MSPTRRPWRRKKRLGNLKTVLVEHVGTACFCQMHPNAGLIWLGGVEWCWLHHMLGQSSTQRTARLDLAREWWEAANHSNTKGSDQIEPPTETHASFWCFLWMFYSHFESFCLGPGPTKPSFHACFRSCPLRREAWTHRRRQEEKNIFYGIYIIDLKKKPSTSN